MNSNLGFVIAAYNEEKTIAQVVASLIPYGKVIVVDDGSKDGTSEQARAAGAIVHRQNNLGYDGALNSGFNVARDLGVEFVITFDADGQHPAEAIPEFIKAFDDGFSLVVGKRPRTQRVAESFFSIYTKWKFKISDPLCGMKGYQLKYFANPLQFDTYKSTGTELMIKYLKQGLPAKEIPIDIKDRADTPRFGRSWRANKVILRSMLKGIFQ